MSSLLKRSAILSFSRFANQAIILLSPMLLVRILSVGEYGGYREFMLYAGLVGSMVTLGIPHSLAYFLPKEPQKERTWVTQSALFILASTSLAAIAIYLLGDLIRARTSFDFITALQLYILFFVNLDFIEYYWLGKKRTDYVLYYSSGRLSARIIVVVIAAYLTREAHSIVLSLVVLEAIRCALVLWYGLSKGWFTREIGRTSLFRQMSYFLPLGGGGLIEVFNARAGMLFISAMIGVEALAFYTIGAFATQIVNVLRGAIADVIFPEIVEMRSAVPKDALPLWKRATVWYCVLLFPTAVVFSYYADAVVITLFTREYADAIPVFSAFAYMLILYSFDFHLPLRVQNANRYFMLGSAIALFFNIGLLYPMYLQFGLIGPVIAFIVSRSAFTLYLAYHTARIYRIGVNGLVHWGDISKILLASLLCVPILVAGKYLIEPLFLRGAVFVAIYFVGYLMILRLLGVWDIFTMVANLVRSRNSQSGAI